MLRPASLYKTLFMLLAAQSLPACTTMAMAGLNGPGVCPPQAIREATINGRVIAGLTRSSTYRDILHETAPVSRERLTFADGRRYEIWQLRTGHPRCSSLEDLPELTPVILSSTGHVLQVGPQAAQSYRAQSLHNDMDANATDEGSNFYQRVMRTVF